MACVALERIVGTACVATSTSTKRTDGVFSLNGRHSMDTLFHSVMASTSVRRPSQGFPKLERLRNTCVVVFFESALVITFSSEISFSEPRLTHGLETGLALLRRPGLAASVSEAAAFAAAAAAATTRLASCASNAPAAAFVTASSKLFPSPYTSPSLYRINNSS